MKRNNNNKNKKLQVHITTMGCSKNLYDSEILMGQFKANDVPLTDDPRKANVLIVNTCGFITPAKQESIGAILEAGQLKKENPGTKLLVCGCLSQRYQPDLRKDIPEVDEYFGTEEFSNILEYLNLTPKSPQHLYETRCLSQKQHYAYLKISEGCNHKCAFCAIPLMRGMHRSRPLEDIVGEARMLAEKGAKELILIAQDTTFYGLDLYKKQRLVDLVHRLEALEGIEWIRLHYAYPTTFQPELAEAMAGSSKIVHYVDMPIQHISDKVLKIMKRGGTSSKIRQIFSDLRNRLPDIALRTTFLVGHPGENEKDFEILKDFVREIGFDRMGVFTYSPEENTSAFSLPHPSEEIAEQRYNQLMNIQQEISLVKNEKKVGETFRVLIDEVDNSNNTAIGRTYADSPEIDNEVIIEDIQKGIKAGDFCNVKITDAREYEIFGKILEG